MENQVNKDRFIELFKKMQDVGASLWIETPLEGAELSRYRIMLDDQIMYDQCSDYLFLLQEYLNRNISMGHFSVEWHKYYGEYLETSARLETDLKALRLFPMDSKSDGFGEIILEIYSELEFLQDHGDPINNHGSLEDSFRIYVQECYEKIQKEYR